MRRRMLVAGLAGAFAAACSLVTSLDGLTGGADPSEGGSDADAAANESGADGIAGETGTDAGFDAAPFCTGGHTFCADFDDGALEDGWTRDNVGNKAEISLSTAHAVSGTASFHSTISRRSPGDKQNALVIKDLVGQWKHIVVDFDMFLDPPLWLSGDNNAAFLAISFFNVTPEYAIYFPIGDGYAAITGPSMNIVVDAVATGRFIHVHVDVDPFSGVVLANINGRAYSGTTTPIAAGTPSMTTVDLGITGYNAPVPAFSAYYDNVVIDQK